MNYKNNQQIPNYYQNVQNVQNVQNLSNQQINN